MRSLTQECTDGCDCHIHERIQRGAEIERKKLELQLWAELLVHFGDDTSSLNFRTECLSAVLGSGQLFETRPDGHSSRT